MSKTLTRRQAAASRFEAYLDAVAAVVRHAGRASPVRDYCRGLLLPGERKSIELIAARLESNRVRALHQSMHHLVAKAEWDDAAVLAEVRRQVLPAIVRNGGLRYLTVKDVVYRKQGIHSVGVEKQHCNPANELENCQVAVSLWASNETASLPVAYQLFLPSSWAGDPARRNVAGVPPSVEFETKAAIALRQLRQAASGGMREVVAVAGAGYGDAAGFRSGLQALGFRYMLAVPPTITVWPLRPQPTLEPVSAKTLALGLPSGAWRPINLRDGGRVGILSRFAAVRVGLPPASSGGLPAADYWLLIEWPGDNAGPTGFWLSDLPLPTPFKSLVWTAKSVWRIAMDSQELKQSIGLGHFEGRGWRGHHHHASLCIAAYGFMVAERCSFPRGQRYVPTEAGTLARLPHFRPVDLSKSPRFQTK